MSTMLDSNKAKTARRVIEVLDYFDETTRRITVMDIVRRYGRPQSSTSELLASLVELGVLYKDVASRSYSLTPRAAILGSLAQPGLIRDGRLAALIDRLGASTGLGVALVGMIGLNAQIFRWRGGDAPLAMAGEPLCGGRQAQLHETAAGRLLLATLTPERREGVIRRLNAEAPPAAKFDAVAMREAVQACARHGHAIGPAGFGASGEMCAVLLPAEADERPMAISFVYDARARVETNGLVELLKASVRRCVDGQDYDTVEPRAA